MSARQLIVLAIAAVAAIGALLLIRGMSSRDAEPTAAAEETIAGEQVLVVTRDIPQGAALVPSDLELHLFPQQSVNDQFIRVSRQPAAQAEYVGAVTRRPFVRGEPITQGSVLHPEGRGFMAAQLEPGFRAVAIEIDPDTSVGGFLQPNDHVDVIVTAEIDGGESDGAWRSEIVLEDIRVLALDDVVQPQTSGDAPTRTTAAVAVLEVTAGEARALAQADGMGDISLALRGVEIETVGMGGARARGGANAGASSGSVRVHAFGNVKGGGG
jgi:pilus assembly protein CpaB